MLVSPSITCVSLVPLKIFPSTTQAPFCPCHNHFLLAYWNFKAQFFVGFVWMSLQICLNMMFIPSFDDVLDASICMTVYNINDHLKREFERD